MALFMARRIASGLVTLLLVSLVIFVSLQVLPGDTAQIVQGLDADEASLDALRDNLDLDEPLPQRYVTFLTGVLRGDFGVSYAAQAQGTTLRVWDLIREPLINSLVLAGLAFVFFIPLSLALGVFAALRAGRPSDHIVTSAMLVLSAIPEFLIGTFLIVIFFARLGWLPPVTRIAPGESPFTDPAALILPGATLVLHSVAYAGRLIRASTLDVLGEDYVAMANLNGFRAWVIVWRYAVRNSLAPNIQVLATTLRFLLGGVIVVEAVFAYPGLGTELLRAVELRDVQVVGVITFLLAAVYILVNILADLAVVLLVPRLRTSV